MWAEVVEVKRSPSTFRHLVSHATSGFEFAEAWGSAARDETPPCRRHGLISEQWDWVASDGRQVSFSLLLEKCGVKRNDAGCDVLYYPNRENKRWIIC